MNDAERRKPGPRRAACPWCASTTCTHCHCEGYAGCDHSKHTACSRPRYKRRLVCNRCEKHKLNHAKRMFNCTPKQLERHATRLQRACARGRQTKQTKPVMVVKLQNQSRVRRFQLSVPLKWACLRQQIGQAYGFPAGTFEIQYKCSGQNPRSITSDETLRKACIHWSEHNPGRHFRLHVIQHDRSSGSSITTLQQPPLGALVGVPANTKPEPQATSFMFRPANGLPDIPVGVFSGGDLSQSNQPNWSTGFADSAPAAPPSPPRHGGFGASAVDDWPQADWGALSYDGPDQKPGDDAFAPLYGNIDDALPDPMLDEMTRALLDSSTAPIFPTQARVLDLGPLPPEAAKAFKSEPKFQPSSALAMRV